MSSMTTSGLLEQYRGSIDAESISKGFNLCQRNARRLADDAKLLIASNRAPSAAALAILSIEESGKPYIMKLIAITKNEKDQKSIWKDFRSHTVKNRHWIMPDLVRGGAKVLKDFRTIAEGGERAFLLDSIKQISIYTDCLGSKGNWSDPENVIDSDFAEGLVTTADLLSRKKDVTVREIELWMEIVGPHNGTSEMARAVVEYQTVIHAEGLSDIRPEVLADFMSEFVREGRIN